LDFLIVKKHDETCFSHGNRVSMIWRSCGRDWEVGFEAEPTIIKKIGIWYNFDFGFFGSWDCEWRLFMFLLQSYVIISIKLSNPLKKKGFAVSRGNLL